MGCLQDLLETASKVKMDEECRNQLVWAATKLKSHGFPIYLTYIFAM
jgi:hypothetical protein